MTPDEDEAENVTVSDAGGESGAGYVTSSTDPPDTETHAPPHDEDPGDGGDATVHPAGSGIVSDVTGPPA